MKNRHVSARIALRLRTAEHAVDKAMVETSALIQAMIESRAEAGLAAEVGHPALVNMVRGLTQLAEARGAVVEGHGGLAAVASAHDLGWRLDGPLEEKPGPVVVGTIAAAA
ncbi:MAG: hypothetical protein QME55_01205 [Brevundimonas sp.]|uniref:hypothetical protein n=1 Tax=Brevundimonas sp. TaxID=1871086 RepID=UPI002638B8D6|nr:hypothetical protein [Brevundimonas sp.]MDI6623322.1 hypothetical protein [Brevundimonas sp.]MDQ7813242.1 hypothetical protein [Brevundimonas sp.]